ncbi:MAG: phosphatase PAP2 family protein [Candidatus Micrarchaeota archaeon]|nr:phosphatase PAP2 family protein [Candidatus Micrarchaeota archaeon]MDE1823669.1 phosphatase PAP2 family protein [Candidatus Micrarchaeota archaeon]MDE1849968.1 phosphatase PAP2 family protein [Candidatus Micrarchaeota archaeon]
MDPISINTWAFRAVQALASPQLNQAMSALADSFYIAVPLLFIYIFFRNRKDAFPFLAAAVALYVLTDIIKFIVKEPRPCLNPDLSWINVVGCEGSYSFPSNHATTLTGLYFFVNNYKYVRILYIVWLIVILFGRVYLGAHYLTDVIAGVTIGLIAGYALYSIRKRINDIARPFAARIGIEV